MSMDRRVCQAFLSTICFVVCVGLAICSTPAGAQEPEGSAAPEKTPDPARTPLPGGAPPPVIREPSQGRPIFITAGETFYFVMSLPEVFKGDVRFSLEHAQEPGVQHVLKPQTQPAFVERFFHLVLKLGSNVPPGLYDLKVWTDAQTYYSRRCIKVVDRFKEKFRFVHLSSMNVGDLTAPEFDEMLPAEINLLAPEFIVATGDYTEWARVKDDSESWRRVLRFFEKFNAPVFMLCGAHDHEASFTDYVASKPVSELNYGKYHGLLLLDHAGHPIDQDEGQVRWVETNLKDNKDRRMNFIVGNSDELGLLDVWRGGHGDLAAFLREHKVRMYLAGGSTDWDFRESADKLAGLEDFHFVRTHQASTCQRDRATGFSHYRVIEVDGDKLAYVYPDDMAGEKLQHSVPTGRMRAYYDAPNDGSATRVAVTVQNALNQSFDNAKVWLRIAKRGEEKPVIEPGRVEQMLDAGGHWACEVAFDLPDKSAVRIIASLNASDIPLVPPVDVELVGAGTWNFVPRSTDFGLTYFECTAEAALKLTNRGGSGITCWPVVRVNGSQLHFDPTVVSRLPLVLESKQSLSLPLLLNLRRVNSAGHELQVYFLDDPLCRLHTFDVELRMEDVVSKVLGDAPTLLRGE